MNKRRNAKEGFGGEPDALLPYGASCAWGAAAFYAAPSAPADMLSWHSFLPIVFGCLCVILIRRRVWRRADVAWGCLWFCLGAGSAAWENERMAPQAAWLTPREGSLIGTAESAETHGAMVKLWLSQVSLDEGPGARGVPCLVRLSYPTSLFPGGTVRPGERFRFPFVSLQPPGKPVMRGAYDYAFFMRMKQVCMNGFGRSVPELLPPEAEPAGLAASAARLNEQWRAEAARKVKAAVPDAEAAGLLSALLTNLRGDVSRSDERRFRDAGLTHLLAISGSHVSMAAGLVYVVIRLFLLRCTSYAIRRDPAKPAALAAMPAAALLVIFVGAPVSAQRALVASCFFLLAKATARRADVFRAGGAALLGLTLVDPYIVTDPGFQMSFFSAGAIVATFLYAERLKPPVTDGRAPKPQAWLKRHAVSLLLSALAAGTAAAPFGLYHFGTLSLAGFAANLIAVPLTGIFIMPPALAGLLAMPFGAELPFLRLAEPGVQALRRVAEIASGWNFADLHVPALHAPSLACFALAWMLFIFSAGMVRRASLMLKAAVALVCAGVVFAVLQPKPCLLIGAEGALVGYPERAGGTLYVDGMRRARLARETWRVRLGLARTAKGASKDGRFTCNDEGCTVRVAREDGADVTLIAARTPAFALRHCKEAAYGVALSLPAETGFSACPHLPVLSYRALERQGAHAMYMEDGGVRAESAGE